MPRTFDCELAPLGLALVDHDCREPRDPRRAVRVLERGAVQAAQRSRRAPLRVGRVVIDDARLEASPSAIVPSVGRVAIAIEHAEAGATVFKTPLSWLFALRATCARTIELPAGISVQLGYHDGKVSASGSIFGSKPVEMPVELPVADLADDAKAEMAKLVKTGTSLAEQLLTHRAEDWIKSKLSL